MSIKIENTQVFGWEAAIRGARNPMNSWEKSDSYNVIDYPMKDIEEDDKHDLDYFCDDDVPDRISGDPKRGLMHKLTKEEEEYFADLCTNRGDSVLFANICIGPADHKLLMNLCKGGTEEAKWRRMVHVSMDITAPLYWWKEFETYKVGTVSNSCSTMHKIHAKEFTLDDFSHEHLGHNLCEEELASSESQQYLGTGFGGESGHITYPLDILRMTIDCLNAEREKFLETKDKKYWYQMIQLLPTSYNQRRTIDLNYEVLASQYRQRKEHKLDEWREYCEFIKTLPYSEFITMEE